jgi:integrase
MEPKREKWAFSVSEASQLINKLSIKPRAMALLCLTSGIRRGELFALRWKHLDEQESTVSVVEAVYCGHFDKPKTRKSIRVIPLAEQVLEVLREWKKKSKKTCPEDLIFGTRNGKPEHSTNVLRRHVYPACTALGLPRASWLTFRRTFSTWSHHKGVPPKTVAELMGHSTVRTQFIYIQGVEEEKRRAAELLAGELARIGQKSGPMGVKSVN